MAPARRRLVFALPVLLCGMPTERAGAEPIAHWLFTARGVENGRVRDLAGSLDAVISGPARLRPDFPPGALLIDRALNRVGVDGLDPASPASALPRRGLTAEAWVAIEETVEWGAIIGAGREGGGDDQGWQLGFRQSSFSFGVPSGLVITSPSFDFSTR